MALLSIRLNRSVVLVIGNIFFRHPIKYCRFNADCIPFSITIPSELDKCIRSPSADGRTFRTAPLAFSVGGGDGEAPDPAARGNARAYTCPSQRANLVVAQ